MSLQFHGLVEPHEETWKH